MKTITYRVHGWWMGPIITVWTTSTEEEFAKYCEEQVFKQDTTGRWVNNEGSHQVWLEIK